MESHLKASYQTSCSNGMNCKISSSENNAHKLGGTFASENSVHYGKTSKRSIKEQLPLKMQLLPCLGTQHDKFVDYVCQVCKVKQCKSRIVQTKPPSKNKRSHEYNTEH